jgi:hypothetical protein
MATMATVTNRSTARQAARPAKDEWGVYDPQQAGLAALYARLDIKDNSNVPVMPAVTAIPEQKIEAPPARPSLRDAK